MAAGNSIRPDDPVRCTGIGEPAAGAAGLEILLHLRRKYGLDIPLGVVVTDLDAHALWLHRDVDWYVVAFLDGQEKAGVAVEAGVAECRGSWRRPKWHVLIQDQANGPDVTR